MIPPMDAAFQVRPLTEDDWATLRELRLAALADSPDAFGPTVESALAQPESYWRAWAKGRPGRMQAFAAFSGPDPVGLISGGTPAEGLGHFGAVWVAPRARGTGLGRELVNVMCTWLAAHGCQRIELEVTDGNPAEHLYESLGFRRTGASHPLREGSPLSEVTMARDVPPTS